MSFNSVYHIFIQFLRQRMKFLQGLWEAVLKCWADKPEERIMFTALLAFLKDFSEETKATFIEGKGTEFSIPDADTPHITY